MFEFRRDQIRALAFDQRGKWEDQVMEHLMRVCPEEVVMLTEEELRIRIQRCAAKAERYEIRAADQVASFVQILFEEGMDFDENPPDPWVTEILNDLERDQYAKVDHLWAYLDGYDQEDLDDEELEDPEEDDGDDEPSEDDEDDVVDDIADGEFDDGALA